MDGQTEKQRDREQESNKVRIMNKKKDFEQLLRPAKSLSSFYFGYTQSPPTESNQSHGICVNSE